jgi:hypothetical protein
MTSDQSPQTSWPDAIRAAMQDYVRVVSDASRDLASSAECFVLESLRVVEQATEKANAAAALSKDMATAAGQAAGETRLAAETLDQSATSAVEAVQKAAKEAAEALNQTVNAAAEGLREETTLVSEQLKADLRQQSEDVLEQIRLAAGSGQDAAAAAQEAATKARAAANDSRAHFERNHEGEASPNGGPSFPDLLERLETDYELISHLVQELHNRIASLPTPSTPEPAATTSEFDWSPPPGGPEDVSPNLLAREPGLAMELKGGPEPATAYEPSYEPAPEPASPGRPAAAPLYPIAYDDRPIDSIEPAAPVESLPVASSSVEEKDTLPKKVAGRVLVTITPVPDFDRLLNLDGALGRMDGIANVSLADYARDEVTFRLEIEDPMTADDFARSFSESTGSTASVDASEEGKLALRLAS